MSDTIKISKSFTIGDWKKLRSELINSNEKWDEAYRVFEDRIYSRFLEPIKAVKKIDKNEGEGFTIALISVVLLEYLAALECGKIYSQESNTAPHFYSQSSKLFTEFIRNSVIFRPLFPSNTSINDKFYPNIRCGLVHEARTLDKDVIISNDSLKNTQPDQIYFKIDEEYRLNRDLLLEKILEHINEKKNQVLFGDNIFRKNFLLKLDDIAGLKHTWYFIYGSNLLEKQLTERLNEIGDLCLNKINCSISGYSFKYNKQSSIDGSSKGNLVLKSDGKVYGIVILILHSKLIDFIDKFEKGYQAIEVEVNLESEGEVAKKSFKALTCISDKICSSIPTKEYEAKVVEGARTNNLPTDYINKYLVTK